MISTTPQISLYDSSLPITREQFRRALQCTENSLNKYYDVLRGACAGFDIDTENRLSAFFAQISHESAGLSVIEENLRYSAERLLKIWPNRFRNIAHAMLYANNPEKLANYVYSGRMGNGPESSGDGWKYRGRGFIQLTGKRNYERLSVYFDEDFLSDPDKLFEPVWCALSSAWFWVYGTGTNLNKLADVCDMISITRKINGGTHGLDDRMRRYQIAKTALAGFDAAYKSVKEIKK